MNPNRWGMYYMVAVWRTVPLKGGMLMTDVEKLSILLKKLSMLLKLIDLIVSVLEHLKSRLNRNRRS